MSKLDVGVGDEFPTEEIHRDSDGVVHHHHYYYRRRPYRWLRILLAIALISLVFRLAQAAGARRPWLAALLFGLHPLLTEAVRVPSFREDLVFGAILTPLAISTGVPGFAAFTAQISPEHVSP